MKLVRTMAKRRLISALLLAVALNVVLLGVASAHAHLASATVAPNSTVTTAPTSITLVFGEESDLQQTKIQVLDAKNTDVTSGVATAASGDAKTWTVSLKAGLSDGVYTVKYHTLTDDDGGIVDGSYTFTIAAKGTAAAGATTAVSEKESVDSSIAAAPATGEGGSATTDKNNSLGLLVGLLAVVVVASSLLVWRRNSGRI